MITRKHFLTLLTTSAMALALVTTGSLAEGKGKPGGGKNNPTLSVSLNSSSIEEGDSTIGTVTRSNADLNTSVTVTLGSSDTNQATVSTTTVTIGEDETTATFSVTGIEDGSPDGDQSVTISAEAGGYQSGSANLTVTEPPPPVEYQLQYINFPNEQFSFGGTGTSLTSINNLGECAGSYIDSAGQQSAWYSPLDAPTTAIDLNDLGTVGLPAGWRFRKAMDINDLGAIVGYVGPPASIGVKPEDRGFVLDVSVTPPVLILLPDQDETWVKTYPRKINENGDVLGVFEKADYTKGAYLFNPGLYGEPDSDVEIVPSELRQLSLCQLNNPSESRPAEVVSISPSNEAFVYTKGGGFSYLTYEREAAYVVINDSGTIGGAFYGIEIQIRKNRTETTPYVMFRDDGILELFSNPEDMQMDLGAKAINAAGVLVSKIEPSGDIYVQHPEFGFVNVTQLLTWNPEDIPGLSLPKAIFSMNSMGPLGFGQIAGASEFGHYVLTPVEVP